MGTPCIKPSSYCFPLASPNLTFREKANKRDFKNVTLLLYDQNETLTFSTETTTAGNETQWLASVKKCEEQALCICYFIHSGFGQMFHKTKRGIRGGTERNKLPPRLKWEHENGGAFSVLVYWKMSSFQVEGLLDDICWNIKSNTVNHILKVNIICVAAALIQFWSEQWDAMIQAELEPIKITNATVRWLELISVCVPTCDVKAAYSFGFVAAQIDTGFTFIWMSRLWFASLSLQHIKSSSRPFRHLLTACAGKRSHPATVSTVWAGSSQACLVNYWEVAARQIISMAPICLNKDAHHVLGVSACILWWSDICGAA